MKTLPRLAIIRCAGVAITARDGSEYTNSINAEIPGTDIAIAANYREKEALTALTPVNGASVTIFTSEGRVNADTRLRFTFVNGAPVLIAAK